MASSSQVHHFSDSGHMKIVMKVLDSQRKHGILCDVTLRIAGVGDETADDQSKSDQSEAPHVITNQIIDMNIDAVAQPDRDQYYDALKRIVEYVYTGDIIISHDNVDQISQLAKLLEIHEIMRFCNRFTNTIDDVQVTDKTVTFVDIEPDVKSDNKSTKIVDKTNKRAQKIPKEPERKKTCPTCGFVAPTFRTLRDHRHNVHLLRPENGLFPCSFCNKEFETKSLLYIHKKIHWHEKASYRYSCSTCHKKFRWRWEVKKHSLNHVNTRSFPCDLCGSLYKTQATLDIHRKLHDRKHPDLGVDLECTGKKLRIPYIPTDTNKLDHGSMCKPIKDHHLCVECGKLFFTRVKFQRHIARFHPNDREFACFRCDFRDTDKNKFASHLLQEHEIGGLCDKQPVVVTNVTEPPVKPPCRSARNKGHFPCTVCPKVFDMKQNLKRHTTEVHGNKKPFTCPECMFQSKRKEYMENHMWFLHKIQMDPSSAEKIQRKNNKSRISFPNHPITLDTMDLVLQEQDNVQYTQVSSDIICEEFIETETDALPKDSVVYPVLQVGDHGEYVVTDTDGTVIQFEVPDDNSTDVQTVVIEHV